MTFALPSPASSTAARAVAILGCAVLCTACAVPAGYDDGYGYDYGYPAYPQGSATIFGGQPTYIYEQNDWYAREPERYYRQREREHEGWRREQGRQAREPQRRDWDRQPQPNNRDQEQTRQNRGRDNWQQRWQAPRQQDQNQQQQERSRPPQNDRIRQWQQRD